MAAKQYTDIDVTRLLKAVEDEFSGIIAKADGEAPAAEPSKEESKKDEKSKDEPKKDEPKDGKSKEEPKKDGEEDHGYDDKDQEEMHKMYASMGKSELRLHKAACEKAHAAKCGEMSTIGKSEAPAVVDFSEPLRKAEAEANSLRKSNEELTKSVDELKKTAALTADLLKGLVRSAPEQKSITDISVIGKPDGTAPKAAEGAKMTKAEAESMAKSEVIARLNAKAMDPALKAQDRARINKYCYSEIGVGEVADLL